MNRRSSSSLSREKFYLKDTEWQAVGQVISAVHEGRDYVTCKTGNLSKYGIDEHLRAYIILILLESCMPVYVR